MGSEPTTFRVSDGTLEAIEDLSDDLGTSRNDAGNRALQEGLREMGYLEIRADGNGEDGEPVGETRLGRIADEVARLCAYSGLGAVLLAMMINVDASGIVAGLFALAATALSVRRLEPAISRRVGRASTDTENTQPSREVAD